MLTGAMTMLSRSVYHGHSPDMSGKRKLQLLRCGAVEEGNSMLHLLRILNMLKKQVIHGSTLMNAFYEYKLCDQVPSDESRRPEKNTSRKQTHPPREPFLLEVDL